MSQCRCVPSGQCLRASNALARIAWRQILSRALPPMLFRSVSGLLYPKAEPLLGPRPCCRWGPALADGCALEHAAAHLVQVDDGAEVLVLVQVEVPHADLAEVTRVVLVEHDAAQGK